MDRRHFVSALSAAPLLAAPGRKYTTALIGTGWWGMNILREALASGQCTVTGLADPDAFQLEKSQEELNKLTSDRPKHFKDYRELLKATRPDIAIVATPDHWHALPTIDALRSGAHVYVEKPIAHTVLEGHAMLAAARAADRTVQVGLHRRVTPHGIEAMRFLRSGKLGKVGMVRVFANANTGANLRTPTPDSEPPQSLDWDLWLGPAPKRAFNKAIHPRGFRQFLDYANGTLGDWGVHWLDQILWWTEETHPTRIYSTGGRYIRQDSTDAPDTQIVNYDFESFRCVWEQRHYAGEGAEKHLIGAYFYGTEGVFHLGYRDGYSYYPNKKGQPTLHMDAQLNQPDGQNIKELWADFLTAIQLRRRPICDIENGNRATSAALLGMVSQRLGRSIEWNGKTCPNDAKATELLRRPYRAPYLYPNP
jgi:predicted dehydrogenase